MSRFMYCAYFALILAYRAAAQADVGCFLDGDAISSSVTDSATNSLMTPEYCQSYCTNFGYSLIYGTGCYCANDATSWTPCDTSCDISCPGNTTQSCGGTGACLSASKVTNDCLASGCHELEYCTETLLGYECGCAEGESLKIDGISCVACPAAGCQQVCSETSDGYVCSCGEGSSLNVDGKTCSAIQPVKPPINRLKHCKKGFLYFLRHLKKCSSVKSRYPKWVLKHRTV